MPESDLAERLVRDYVRSAGAFDPAPYDADTIDTLTQLVESLSHSDGMLLWSALTRPTPTVTDAVIELLAGRLRALRMAEHPES